MKKHLISLSFFIAIALLLSVATSFSQPLYYSGNGHYYELVTSSVGLTWDQARTAAEARTHLGMRGHLVTYQSQQEDNFVLTNYPQIVSNNLRVWLGGFQPFGSPEPSGNWQWVTGESWGGYIHWAGGEPNNYGGDENCMDYANGNGAWNDENCNRNDETFYYVVEYEAIRPTAVPAMTEWGVILFLILIGISSICYLRKQRRTVT